MEKELILLPEVRFSPNEEERALILKKDASLLEADGKSRTFLVKKIGFYNSLWWERWEQMMTSTSPDLVKEALREYNKLQCRLMPTELVGVNGEGITINVVNYAPRNEIKANSGQSSAEAIPGKIIVEAVS